MLVLKMAATDPFRRYLSLTQRADGVEVAVLATTDDPAARIEFDTLCLAYKDEPGYLGHRKAPKDAVAEPSTDEANAVLKRLAKAGY